jgi:hypothetical protein
MTATSAAVHGVSGDEVAPAVGIESLIETAANPAMQAPAPAGAFLISSSLSGRKRGRGKGGMVRVHCAEALS